MPGTVQLGFGECKGGCGGTAVKLYGLVPMNLAQKVSSSAVALLAALAALLIMTNPGGPPPPSGRANARELRTLIVPVFGMSPEQLHDNWGHARSEGRTHAGIDIMAPSGVAVLAAVDGRIVKFFDSARGGVTIYQFDEAERFVYYYAHLSARAQGLSEGQDVRRGEVIGYVGASGNATTPHLHFEIQRLGSERRWWVAESQNPYPLLQSGRAPE